MAENDGGQAFPGVETPAGGIPGMSLSLRDYFAAHALQGLLSDPQYDGGSNPPVVARDCYQYADALLAEREV